MAEKKLQSDLLSKAEEAAKQYERAELFWACSNMSDENIGRQRRRFMDSYGNIFEEIKKSLFPQNPGKTEEQKEEQKEARAYLEKKGILTVFDAYENHLDAPDKRKNRQQIPDEKQMQNQAQDQKRNQMQDPAGQSAFSQSIMDASITERQREGLRKFHQWMYRNCDREGIKYFGEKLFGADGSARGFVEKFMNQPASIQLKALYLLENDKRKTPDENGMFSRESQSSYEPDLDRLKDKLTATKWKFWKRSNGSYLYWNKLNEALETANANREELLDFREKANKLAKENPANYRESKEFKNLLDGIKGKNSEAGEYQSTVDKVEELSGVIADAYDSKYSMESVAMNIETGSKQVKRELHSDKENEVEEAEGYISRLVKKLGGEQVARHYENISTIGLSAASLVSGGFSIYNGIKERIGLRGVQNAAGQVSESFGIGSTGAYSTQTATDIMGAIGDYANAENFTKFVGKFGVGAFGAANLLIAAKGTTDLVSGIRGRSHAERAKELGEELGKKEIQNRAELSKFLNEKKRNSGIRGFIQGSTGVTAAGISLFASSVPVVGQAAGLVSFSMALYEGYVQSNKDFREKYRKGIDMEFFGGQENLENEDQEFKKKLEERKKHLSPASKAYKKIDELCDDKNKEKRLDILRKEKAVEKDCVFLRDGYEKAVTGIAEDAYRNVFFIDPKKGGEYTNLITKEKYQEYFSEKKINSSDSPEEKAEKEVHNREVKIRMSYKELMESFGAKVKFSSENTAQAEVEKESRKTKQTLTEQERKKKTEERMKQKMEKKMEKISATFSKM